MALRQIRQLGEEILTKKAKPVRAFDAALHTLVDDMWDTLRANDGLGLAAPQVGVLRQIVVIEIEEETIELINPKLVEFSGSNERVEACLSIPNKQGNVKRPSFVKVEAVDRNGEPFVLETEDDLLTTALCHELDHLEGILFLEKATNIQDGDALKSQMEQEEAINKRKIPPGRRNTIV